MSAAGDEGAVQTAAPREKPERQRPQGVRQVLRYDDDGYPGLWIDDRDRLCGGPNGPIVGSLPFYLELKASI